MEIKVTSTYDYPLLRDYMHFHMFKRQKRLFTFLFVIIILGLAISVVNIIFSGFNYDSVFFFA